VFITFIFSCAHLLVKELNVYGVMVFILLCMFADLEYDHLDYSRPGSSWKPHYQRMANGFAPHSKDGSIKDYTDTTD
jgi:hypothetical protein